ncbi:MFS transporter [Fructilactobacillus frigidiflavus]|uniref:MFS transporter n=1 Tax=Fructilactobacillus frigidiflavus TaxID=3242688 RepID=UPI003756981B
MQIKHHNYSYFMSNYGYRQSGQIVNALYGPYMTYLLGFILLVTHSWFWFEMIVDFIILTVSGLGAYVLFRRLKINYFLAVSGAIIYLSQNFITYWITSSAFLDWGAMILPYAVMVALDLLYGSPKKVHYTLAIVVALLLEMHVLSTVITIVMFLPFFLIGFIRSRQKVKYFSKICLNAILSMVLSANYFAAFYNVFLHNKLIPPFSNENLKFGAMKMVFPNITQSEVGIVFIIIITTQIFITIFNFKRSRLNLGITIIGLFLFILSSEYFPWNQTGRIFCCFQNFLQYPSRFFAFAALLMLTGFLMSMNQIIRNSNYRLLKYSYYAFLGILAISALMLGMKNIKTQMNNDWKLNSQPPQVGVYASHLLPYGYYPKGMTKTKLKTDFESDDLSKPLNDVTRSVTDYLPDESDDVSPCHLQNKYRHQITYNTHGYHKHVLDDGSIDVTWHSKKSMESRVPMVAYHDTVLKLNGKILKKVKNHKIIKHQLQSDQYQLTDIGGIYLAARRGKNKLNVSYKEPIYFTLSLYCSIFAWISVLIFSLFNKMLKKPSND